MNKQEIVILDFEESYPPLDNPLEALLLSLAESDDYECIVYTSNELTLSFAKQHDISYKYISSASSRNILTFFSLVRLLRKKNILIHAFGTRSIEVITPLHHYFGKGKVIYTFTSIPQFTSLSKLQRQYQKVSFITAPTRHFINTMAHVLQLPQNKTSVIPVGITKEHYESSLPYDSRRIIFTVVAPLEHGSSLFEILDALNILHKANILPDWEVRFVGRGALFSSLIEYATQIDIVDRVALLGDYPLPTLLEKTTVLIIPVFFWYVSQAIYGGILSQVPIIHTKDPNVLDIVNFHHKDISSFTQGDSVEIRSAIKYALESQQTLSAPIYSLEQTIHAFHAIYRRIL